MQTTQIGVIACEVLRLEVESLLPGGSHCVFLEQNLHNTPTDLHSALQKAISEMDACPEISGIALGYGLCSKVIEGLSTSRCRMAIPRAHDCITLLLGDRHRYAEYIAKYPGTYWYSPGWIGTGTQPSSERYEKAYRDYCERFDQEDAEYLMETEQSWLKEYNRACYVDIGVGDRAGGEAFTRECAKWLDWSFDSCAGRPDLLRDLLAGKWNDENFLVLEPGETAVQALDQRVLRKAE